jgi:threonine/homoserine/homoserine lactone efflux protein
MLDSSFFIIALLYFIGISSPGPSLIFIITSSLCIGRKQGLMSAIGVVTAIAVQVVLVLFFLKLIAQNNSLFNILRYSCAVFLVYIGISLALKDNQNTGKKLHLSNSNFFFKGFFIELLNPIVMTFFLSIFTLYAKSENWFFNFLYLLEVLVIGTFWFLGLVFLICVPRFYNIFSNYRNLMYKISSIFFFTSGLIIIFNNKV